MTKEVFVVIALCSSVLDVVFCALEPRIVGGMPVKMSSFPYAVQVFNMDSMCAGSIISSQGVLTAAHCFSYNMNTEDMTIRTGEAGDSAPKEYDDSELGIYDVWDFYMHEEYDNELFSNDIAIIFASRPFKLGRKAKKVLLVKSKSWMKADETFIAIGWGWINYGGPVSKGLLMTHLKFVPLRKCMKDHGNTTLTKDMFCLYGNGTTDTCRGDSGGGVTWKGFLAGVVSHGDGCAEKNKPSVYTNVWYFRNWIKKGLLKFHEEYCNYAFSNGSFEIDDHGLSM